ncbi:uncharacterized protein NPIL_291531 [Nephila pilipes]|uniref:Mutator-like transposase domain-containing protein n=1 Tax=Nephila pilipes TaxID=299642 RepID=A0A8X6PBP7_NEPPI|nr:uncharacterized protein NPIL_291531 [Nephila pilipes]
MRCIGKGAESAVMFCGIMNLLPPPTKFNNILLQAARETCEESMAEAVHEAVEENEGGKDIAVAVDGSWQKRSFPSKNGVVTVTSVDTGKISHAIPFELTVILCFISCPPLLIPKNSCETSEQIPFSFIASGYIRSPLKNLQYLDFSGRKFSHSQKTHPIAGQRTRQKGEKIKEHVYREERQNYRAPQFLQTDRLPSVCLNQLLQSNLISYATA